MASIPLTSEHAAGDVSKRRATRQKIETLLYADLGPGNGGFPLNISEYGMAFQGVQPLETGQKICIKLKLPGTRELVEATGQVIWLNELGKGGGLEFIDLAEESYRLISQSLGLHTGTNGQPVNVPSSSREIGKKQLQFPSPPPEVGREAGRPGPIRSIFR